LAELQKLTQPYRPTAYYQSQNLAFIGSNLADLAVLKDGKENFDPEPPTHNGYLKGTDSFTSNWQLMSGALLRSFMLPGKTPTVDNSGQLPVVAPYTAVEQLLGLEPLPPLATPSARLVRLKEVRQQAADLHFSVCYRNSTSRNMVNEVIAQQQEIARNKTNKDYHKPALVYGLPTTPCGSVQVVADARSAADKKLADKQTSFRRTFGEPAPISQILSFKVIGISPDPPDFAAPSFSNVLKSLLSSNLGQPGWYTPLELRQTQPLLSTFFPVTPEDPSQIISQYVELPSADSARQLINQQNCQPHYGNTSQADPLAGCPAGSKTFMFTPFGSSSLAVDEAQRQFGKVFHLAALAVTAVAAVIMIGTVGRVIADSRRETAVYRAIGAKRLDIAQIYFTYTIFLASLVAATSLLFGFLLASLANNRWADELTVQSLIVYNAQNLNRHFSLFGVNTKQLLYLIGLTILAGLLSAVVPLLANLRRNPINDMRDEN